jgi:lysophospholipase L1-like esterase
MIKLNGKTIVFYGDSITDSCKNFNKNHPYGAGYVNMIKSELDVFFPDINVTIYNEGIGGNKTSDLINRFDDDVKSKNPDLVFLLIGINDIWHPYDAKLTPNINKIIENIDIICNKIKNIDSNLVILTPFLFPTDDFFKGLMPYFNQLLDKLYLYINNNKYDFIDTYSIMKNNSNLELTKDSIHPTIYGHSIIAQAIVNYLKK